MTRSEKPGANGASTPAPADAAARPPTVGTLGWLEATRGRLRGRDRIRLLAQGTVSYTPELFWRAAGPLGLRPRRRARLDLDELEVPDSLACREAEELCVELRPAMLVNHSYRTYAWASILAHHEGLAYDAEVLYVSALLHDLGLSTPHRTGAPPVCFTAIGADAARRVASEDGWPSRRADLAAEAITLHMNLRTDTSKSVESYLMAAGTHLDAIGARYRQIDPGTVSAVLERYPRGSVKEEMVRAFRIEARQGGSRAQFYWRYLLFRWWLGGSPFES